MANQYDRIIKENLRGIVNVLIKNVIGIKSKKIKTLETKFQRTEERKADFILEIHPLKGERFILHIEFQSDNDRNMILRMMRYWLFIKERYGLPLRQYVIYIGKAKLKMGKSLRFPEISYRYELIDMSLIKSGTCVRQTVGHF